MNRLLRSSLPYSGAHMVLPRLLLLWLLAGVLARAEDSGAVLRMLKALPAQQAPSTILDSAWPYLDSQNAAIRETARQAIQSLPFAAWRDRALEEKSTWASLEILRALAESCPRKLAREVSPHLCEQITTLRIEQMDEPQLLAAQRLTRLVFEKLGPVSEDERHQMLDLWSALPAAPGDLANRERQALLDYLRQVRPRQP